MQIPPVERTVNRPPATAGSRAGAGSKSTNGQATAEIQDETSPSQALNTTTPSVRLTILTTQEDIAKFEVAEQARSAVRTVPKGESAQAKALKANGGVEAHPPALTAQAMAHRLIGATHSGVTADNGLHSETPETAAKVAKLVEAGKEPGPNQPLTTEKALSTDWTTTPKAVEKKPVNPPPEPISKKLLDFLQVLWQASGNAVEVTPTARPAPNLDKLDETSLTYKDPSTVKKATGV